MLFSDPITLFESDDGKAVVHKQFFQGNLINTIKNNILLKQEKLTLYGKEVTVPRLVAYEGELPYSYSNITHKAHPFSEITLLLKQQIEAETDFMFNSVLFNFYENGRDYMGYHRDNEPELDQQLIASVSFGAARKFKFKHRKNRETIDVVLENGDLLLMYECQTNWEHALPKSLKVTQPRMNLTFRKIIA